MPDITYSTNQDKTDALEAPLKDDKESLDILEQVQETENLNASLQNSLEDTSLPIEVLSISEKLQAEELFDTPENLFDLVFNTELNLILDDKAKRKSLISLPYILNYNCNRDPSSGEPIHQRLLPYLTALNDSVNGNEPQVYYRISQICDYIFDSVKFLIAKYKTKLVRQHEMIPFHAVKELDNTSFSWLSNLPGRDFKQKLAYKNKVKAPIKVFSADTQENRVVKRILGDFYKILNPLLENVDENDEQLANIIQCRRNIEVLLKQTELSEIKKSDAPQPNNVLVGHKHYSRIWKIWNWMKGFEDELSFFSTYQDELIVASTYWSLIAELNSYDNISIDEEFIKLSDIFINHYPGIKKSDGIQWIISKKQKISIIRNLEKTSVEIRYSKEGLFLKDFFSDCEIKVEFNLLKETASTNRGKSLELYLFYGENALSINSYADVMGNKKNIASIVEQIGKIFNLTLDSKKTYGNEQIKYDLPYFAIDFIEYKAKTSPEYIDFKTRNLIYKFNLPEKTISYIVKNQNIEVDIYRKDVEVLPLSDILNQEDSLSEIDSRDILDNVFDSYRNELNPNYKLQSSIAIPDNLEIFDQKDLLFYFRSHFGKVNPLWRSVAAAMATPEAFYQNKKAYVLDCMLSKPTLTIIECKYNKELEDALPQSKGNYFVHRPSLEFDYPDLSYENFKQSYMKEFINTKLEYSYKELNFFKLKHLMKKFSRTGEIYELLNSRKQFIAKFNKRDNKIVFDENIFNKYISAFRSKIGRIKKQNIKENLILIHDSLENHFVDSLKREISIFAIDSEKITTGCYNYLQRIEKDLPTFTEYLPNLSLEIVRNGHYSFFNLLKDNSIDLFSSTTKIFEIGDEFTLSKGIKEFDFPLYSDGKPLTHRAVLKHHSFPLKKDLKVKMELTYRYGLENYYELKLKPINEHFKEPLIILWEKEQISNVNIKNIVPEFPDIKKPNNVIRIDSFLNTTERFVETFKAISNTTDNSSIILQFMEKLRKTSIFLYNASRFIDEEDFFIVLQELQKNEFFKYIGKYAGITENDEKIDFSNNLLNNLREQSLIFLSSFGKYTPKKIVDYIVTNHNLINQSGQYVALTRILRTCSKREGISENIKSIVTKLNVWIDNNYTYSLKREIANSLWFNDDIVLLMQPIATKLIDKILLDFKFMKSDVIKNIKLFPKLTGNYNDDFNIICKILLALLRLRELPEYDYLAAGSKKMLEIARNVRILDGMFYENNIEIRSSIKFSIKKPENLYNMSDIAYVLNGYLTGSFGNNLPSITDIEDD